MVPRMKNLAQQIEDFGAEPGVGGSADLTTLLKACLDAVALGNAQTSFGLWESAYHQADLAKTAVDIASRTLSGVQSPELRVEVTELLSLARRDLGACPRIANKCTISGAFLR